MSASMIGYPCFHSPTCTFAVRFRSALPVINCLSSSPNLLQQLHARIQIPQTGLNAAAWVRQLNKQLLQHRVISLNKHCNYRQPLQFGCHYFQCLHVIQRLVRYGLKIFHYYLIKDGFVDCFLQTLGKPVSITTSNYTNFCSCYLNPLEISS